MNSLTWEKSSLILFLFYFVSAIVSSAQTFTTLHSFSGGTNGSVPYGAPVQGINGDLFGTANGAEAAANGDGTVYAISTTGSLTTLHSFCPTSPCTDGSQPAAGLVQDSSGNFYGITQYGGSNGEGSIFKITATGTLTTVYSFCVMSGCTDGETPGAGPLVLTNGLLYGTTYYGGQFGKGVIYKITTGGTLTTLYSFCSTSDCADGANPTGGLALGSDGNFYGETDFGGAQNQGTIFKVTSAGKLTTLHSFCSLTSCADGSQPVAGLVQATNGNFYGTTTGFGGGSTALGTVFQITTSGKLTTLHSFDGSDGDFPEAPLIQASDGNFYGTTYQGGMFEGGTIFKITPGGTLTPLYNFCSMTACVDGEYPQFGALTQDTNGNLYGVAAYGGTNTTCANGCGVFYSLSVSLAPFINLTSYAGHVGSTVAIFGQGFSGSSVVKFNGVAATKTVLTGTTYITATVPTGATDGYVTVTTGTTTLKSTQKYTVHNSWASGAAVPVAVAGAASGVISGKIYLVTGVKTSGAAPVSNNQVYNPPTNSWTTGTEIPTPVFAPASAVVSGSLYVIGGYEGASQTPSNLVQIYSPKTNAWATGASMPTARGSVTAVVDGASIYVIGGNGSTDRLTTVEKYVPSTNTWSEEAPLLTGVSELSAGLLGSTIVAADGFSLSGDLGTTEGYKVSTNAWSALTSDPIPRNASCFGVVSGLLYAAGGVNGPTAALTTTESFSATSNKWTSLLAMPSAALWQASAVDSGQLYCFGGESSFQGTVISNVQIFQP